MSIDGATAGRPWSADAHTGLPGASAYGGEAGARPSAPAEHWCPAAGSAPHGRSIIVGMRARKVDYTTPPLTPHDERRAAVAAGCDPRTIRAFFDPVRRPRMRSTVAARIGDTLRALGLGPATSTASGTPST